MFKSKRLSKMAAKLTAVTMCAALIGTTAPITATENDTVLLNADFEPTSESVLSKDFTDGNCATVTFENGQRPFAEIQTDENNNNYAIIDAGKFPDGDGWISDWVNGGYLFDDGKQIENGNWTISFDFNVESGGSYANVSLAKSNVKGEEYGQFRLLGTDGTNVLVNKIALDNGTPVTNKWYHYEMKLNKTANTYTVEITDPNDASFKATQSGSVSQTYAFEGLMFGAAMRVAMDNISIMGEKINAPEFVKLGSGITCSISDGVAYIQNVGAWDYGAFLFKNAMGTAGKYEIKFDFKANNITGGYGAVYLTDSAMGGNSQPKEFQLLNIVDGKLCSGIYYTSSE
ncbi:MAG: hypothetical protein PUJ07_07545, partial [Eubacteriales bacterium]|nr:hypothetical protein [Eubacteriales bacterium]